MAAATAEKTPVITDIQSLGDHDLKAVLEEVQGLSLTLLTDRLRESAAAAKKATTWAAIQEKLSGLGRNLAFDNGAVKLSFAPESKVEVQSPDLEKIAEVAPELVARKAKLTELLAGVEAEIAELGKVHFTTAAEPVKMKLTVTAAKPRKPNK